VFLIAASAYLYKYAPLLDLPINLRLAIEAIVTGIGWSAFASLLLWLWARVWVITGKDMATEITQAWVV